MGGVGRQTKQADNSKALGKNINNDASAANSVSIDATLPLLWAGLFQIGGYQMSLWAGLHYDLFMVREEDF